MTEAGRKYDELERRILMGRVNGTLTGAEENSLIEQMDDVWWDMTEEEVAIANAGAILWNKILDDGPIAPRHAEVMRDVNGKADTRSNRIAVQHFIDRGMMEIDDDLKLAIVRKNDGECGDG
jgi:hypothetical protein